MTPPGHAAVNPRAIGESASLCFEDFVLDIAKRELRKAGELVPLEPQVFDLLIYVVQNRDRVVSKDDLLAAVWGGRIVSESTLTTRINALRKALGDSGTQQRLIRTVARKGIRFVGTVEEAPIDGLTLRKDQPRVTETSLPLPDKPSIAVLPFQNLSGDPEQEYFCDGMVEEIITALSRLRWFFVIARNSSFSYKGTSPDVRQVGRDLGVRYILEGSVRKAGNRLRIAAQLVDAATGNHLWAERYDRELADIFAIQDEITESVVGSIEPQLYGAENMRAKAQPPANLDAWGCVMRALSLFSHMTAEDTRKALSFLERAISLDPNYARALALLVWTRVRSAYYGWGGDLRTVVPQAKESADKAVALDHDDPWVHFALGYIEFFLRRQQEAVAALGKAIELNPNFALAHGFMGLMLASGGRPEEAIEAIDRALRMSPRDPFKQHYFHHYSLACCAAGRFTEAANWAQRALQERADYVLAHRSLVANCALAGDLERARAALTTLRRLQPGISLAWAEENLPYNDALRQRFVEGLRRAGLPE
ncbi:MAG: winged helix-turn-helix domain-containing protein [Proteobacteria bacterium]|nr:winged helix-turn-helix domain-containing protein [Pseudomonadota bacterium]MBI3498967.1 winged helix-turn-helix domain-containing protein [Pseudomonadota bacterium]